MSSTAQHSPVSDPQDICLLLRLHAEEHWLTNEVLPVLRELEPPCSTPPEQLGAALAYLEVLWLDACTRAAETDAASTLLGAAEHDRDPVLDERTRRYHAAVRRLRIAVGHRVAERIGLAADAPSAGTPAPVAIAYAQPNDTPLRSAVTLHAFRRRAAGG
ncbi:MAG TPA: hypothetical protein VGN13_06765 [Solirubrobacteraceae bacterium]|jgi:hypothetical protein